MLLLAPETMMMMMMMMFQLERRTTQRLLSVTLLLFISLSFKSGVVRTEAQLEEWCIADVQTPEDELQRALDWACSGKGGGANCSLIQPNQACYLPNTIKDHASYAFNSYYQKFKHKGGSCYFNSAALVTSLDPSHGGCKYEYIP